MRGGAVGLLLIILASGCGGSTKNVAPPSSTTSLPAATTSAAVAPSTTLQTTATVPTTLPLAVDFCLKAKLTLLAFTSFSAATISRGAGDPTPAERTQELHSSSDAMATDASKLARGAPAPVQAPVAALHAAVSRLVSDYMIPTGYFSTGAIPITRQSAYFNTLAQIASLLKRALTLEHCV